MNVLGKIQPLKIICIYLPADFLWSRFGHLDGNCYKVCNIYFQCRYQRGMEERIVAAMFIPRSAVIWPHEVSLFISLNVTTVHFFFLLTSWCLIYSSGANWDIEKRIILRSEIYWYLCLLGEKYFRTYCVALTAELQVLVSLLTENMSCLFACWGKGEQKLKCVDCDKASYLPDRTYQNGHRVTDSLAYFSLVKIN